MLVEVLEEMEEMVVEVLEDIDFLMVLTHLEEVVLLKLLYN